MPASFHLYSKGQRFEGLYEIAGRTLTVRTAYGARRAPLGVMKPLKLAKTLYRVILRDVANAPDTARITAGAEPRIVAPVAQ